MKAGNPNGGINIAGIDVLLLMYVHVDDLVLVSNSPTGLQESLDLLYDYCTKWKLTVNMSKSKILICKNCGPRMNDEVWFYGDQILDECTAFSYLGVTFTACGITNYSIDVLTGQAKKALATLYANMQSIGTFTPSLSLKCFHTCISPILNYNSGVWGYMEARSMQTLFNRFCKNILGVKLSTSNYAVASELGQYPLIIGRTLTVIKYWMKIILGDHGRLRFYAYRCLRNILENN